MSRENFIPTLDEFINEKKLMEATTPQFKALVKRAKQLGVSSFDELRDLISDEFSDEDAPITGADFEIAAKQLRIREEEENDEDEEELNEERSIHSIIARRSKTNVQKVHVDEILEAMENVELHDLGYMIAHMTDIPVEIVNPILETMVKVKAGPFSVKNLRLTVHT